MPDSEHIAHHYIPHLVDNLAWYGTLAHLHIHGLDRESPVDIQGQLDTQLLRKSPLRTPSEMDSLDRQHNR